MAAAWPGQVEAPRLLCACGHRLTVAQDYNFPRPATGAAYKPEEAASPPRSVAGRVDPCARMLRVRAPQSGRPPRPAGSIGPRIVSLAPHLSPRLRRPRQMFQRERLNLTRIHAAALRTIPDRQASASIACMNAQVFVLAPILSFRQAALTTCVPEFGHFSALCRRSWCGWQPSAPPTAPGIPPW